MARRQSKDPLERLDTPEWMTRALLSYLPTLRGRDVIEPCAGANAITYVLEREGGCRVSAFDIEPRADSVAQADTMTPGFFEQIAEHYPWRSIALVTNTPFSLAADYCRRGSQLLGLTALLVRITWLEATKDREDVRDPDALIILPRGKFTGPGAIDPETGQPYTGGDNATVCWAIWQHPSISQFLTERPIIRVNRREKADLERAPVTAAAVPSLFGEVPA